MNSLNVIVRGPPKLSCKGEAYQTKSRPKSPGLCHSFHLLQVTGRAVVLESRAHLVSKEEVCFTLVTSGALSLDTTRPRHTHCISIWKLRGVTTPCISSKVVDCSSPSLKGPSNIAAKYGDCLQRRAFGSLYSLLADPMRIAT